MNFNKKMLSVLVASLVISGGSLYAKTAATAAGSWVVDGTIAGTPHDLSGDTNGTVGNSDNGELCVYCHTPHAANSAFDGAPLWNKKAPNLATTYRLYGASAADTQGVTLANTAVGSASGELSNPSLACLSCHDGVSAVNSIVNAPGSGKGNLETPGTPLLMTTISAGSGFGGFIGDGNNTVADVDMANDHPVSVPYPAAGTSATNPASLKARTTVITTGTWSGVAAGETIAKILRTGGNNVECSTCHDPHNGYASDQLGTQVNYLRATNVGSGLCLTCHDK